MDLLRRLLTLPERMVEEVCEKVCEAVREQNKKSGSVLLECTADEVGSNKPCTDPVQEDLTRTEDVLRLITNLDKR
eukprot:3084952-Pyramimonas_sp.AAC.1